MATVEEELRRMGVDEQNVPKVASAIYDAAVLGECSIDRIISGLKMLIRHPVPVPETKTDING